MNTIKSTVAVLLTTSLLFGCGQKEEATPAADKTEKTAAASSNLDQVSAEYRDYAILEIEEFVKETEAFTNAVISGDIEKAKELYAPARMHYERAEP
ncbi:imelysin family protein, partial [Peribacillus psychrosaccharolyticus]